MAGHQAKRKIEFGDFQTPGWLAREVCRLLGRIGCSPASVLEPTCGKGAFLRASLGCFPRLRCAWGFDSNPEYVQTARRAVTDHPQARVENADFFTQAWDRVLCGLPEPILVVGNPPWVTNATVGALGGTNLPGKSNVERLRGIDALTGRSNFDISEWMLRETIRWLDGRRAWMAVLCKTTVARRVLSFCWSRQARLESARLYRIDASQAFGVSVDACLLVVSLKPDGHSKECEVYEGLSSTTPVSTFGRRADVLVADLVTFDRLAFLHTPGLIGWRSGVKHDCRRVFELEIGNDGFVNGFGEHVDVELEVVFPLLKSSDVARGRAPRKFMIIPHRSMAASPLELERRAPAAWRYLKSHAEILARRRSSIYKERPPFSIFGIGPYSLTDWKVAISGLHKELRFTKVGPKEGRPVVLDDTSYLFPCDSREECEVLHDLVSSPTAISFWSSLLFWDSKRPITARVLNMLDLAALARHLGCWTPVARRLAERQRGGGSSPNR
ncbi:MAG: SAM-dependent DNA methyltransferase [Deltaproteobacteria bacterium]|nr:MAG: SAM-dependent DNA methyltransferase [Deltaproteobacteria bacterium]